MGDSIVLEEDIDPNYIPTEDELIEYGESLGMVFPEDNDLIYLAQEGLKARLPKEWKPCQTKDDQIFYFNFETGESVWEHPCDTLYKKKVRDAKEAKRNKSKPKTLTHSKKLLGPSTFSPVMEQNENPELSKRKKEMEEELGKYTEELKKEYFDKKNTVKRNLDKELEEKKEKIRKAADEKLELELKGLRNKVDQQRNLIRKQFEKEENEVLNKEKKVFDEKVREVQNRFNGVLDAEKKECSLRVEKKAEEVARSYKRTQELEVEGLRNEIKYLKQKINSEFQDAEAFKDKHHEKVKKMREKLAEDYETSKKLIEKDIEKQLRAIKQEENGELQKDDLTLLYNLEKDLNSSYSRLVADLRQQNHLNLQKEKEKLSDRNKSKSKKHRLDLELAFKQDLATRENDLKKMLSESVLLYQEKKLADMQTDLHDHQQKLSKFIHSEEQQASLRKKSSVIMQEERKLDLESKIRSLQKELANIEHLVYIKSIELDEGKDEETRLRTEIHRTEIEKDDLQAQDFRIETVVVADLEKQLVEKENEIQKFSESENDRLRTLENEVKALKMNLYGNKINQDSDKVKLALANEKEELRQIQIMLKQDRDKWNKEMKEYKANPTERKRIELYNIKRIIEKNINKHNVRVKELKQAEDLFRPEQEEVEASEDEELLLEMWRNTDVKSNPQVAYTRQPWQNHNLHVYQRQVNKWCKSREYMKDVMMRHGSWLNNMKEQLNRVMSTPHSIKTFY